MIYAKPPWWDHEAFLRDFVRSEAYWPPLKLEDAKEATFLETTFDLPESGEVSYWLKNDNAKERKIWRYQHWRSHAPYAQKKALVVATMRKVHKMASDQHRRYTSAIDKMREFIALRYPPQLLRSVCNLLGWSTGDSTWIGVRNTINDIDDTRMRERQRTVQRPVCN